MAEFFNRKEEVIDLQLTRHGRYLLSIGKFKPASYSFFDDDILYDSEYAGLTEIQNNASKRIKELFFFAYFTQATNCSLVATAPVGLLGKQR